MVVGLDLREDLRARAVEIAEVLRNGAIGIETSYEELGLGCCVVVGLVAIVGLLVGVLVN